MRLMSTVMATHKKTKGHFKTKKTQCKHKMFFF